VRLTEMAPDLVEMCMADEENTLALEDLIRRAASECCVQRWKLLTPRADP